MILGSLSEARSDLGGVAPVSKQHEHQFFYCSPLRSLAQFLNEGVGAFYLLHDLIQLTFNGIFIPDTPLIV